MTSKSKVFHKLLTITALLLTGLSLIKIIPSRADYTGPDRTITTYSWQRRVCRYQAVYDPDGPGWYGCSLTLYKPPESSCPSTGSASTYFNPTACPGWPGSCTSLPCDISLSSSVDGCSDGDSGCRSVAHTTTLPEATVSGSITCDNPGSNGWCRGTAVLPVSCHWQKAPMISPSGQSPHMEILPAWVQHQPIWTLRHRLSQDRSQVLWEKTAGMFLQ